MVSPSVRDPGPRADESPDFQRGYGQGWWWGLACGMLVGTYCVAILAMLGQLLWGAP